jgi:GTP-binding protein LepA
MSEPLDPERIRNFSIIAHIDHGKSTLADRLIQRAGAVSERELREQTLDDMDLERERGITIKASAVTLDIEIDGESYRFNLIDTPGHVDFHYEVDRALAACDGALLVVDAAQGVQAQTVANAYAAAGNDLEIIPVVNKIDLPGAQPEDTAIQIEHVLGIDVENVQFVSAKTGEGVDELLRTIVRQLPPPKGDSEKPLQALVFDSEYDDYRGVICYLRVANGVIRKGQKILLMGRRREYVISELGQFRPARTPCEQLRAGQVGYMVAAIKSLQEVTVGDTITDAASPAPQPLPGYDPPQQMVFCDFYPASGEEFSEFRCGFLGLLHMDIVQERLERECGVDVVQTAPSVTYEVLLRNGETGYIESAGDLPGADKIQELREPIVEMQIITPAEGVGPIMTLCEQRRGQYKRQEYLSPQRVMLTYELPFNEILYDFYDKLKSMTRGYGTMDYHAEHHRAPLQCGPPRAAHPAAAAAGDRPAPVRGGLAGGDRQQGDRAREPQAAAQERDGQVLRGGRDAQAQTAGEAEGGQEADEDGRPRGHPAEGVHDGARAGGVTATSLAQLASASREFTTKDTKGTKRE